VWRLQTRLSAEARLAQAKAQLSQAQVNLERTRIRSPVDGYVTNLLVQLGDYVNVGANTISIVDGNSFWVDGYFEETNLAPIRVGDPARIKLMGYTQIVRGHVDSISRAINVSNAQPNNQGGATVNPIFTWVRLAQRIPVRAALALVELELPQWRLHRLVYEEDTWLCSLSQQWNLRVWLSDCAESRHQSLPIAILSALIEARQCSEPPSEPLSSRTASSVPQCGGEAGFPIETMCCDNFA
jgi:hypothetical protein